MSLRILFVQGLYGGASGEDRMFHQWKQLLESFGETEVWSQEIGSHGGFAGKAERQLASVWDFNSTGVLSEKLKAFNPHLVVFGNLEAVSPAAIHTVAARRIPVICCLHNFRSICGSGILYRQDKVCTLCPSGNWTAAVLTRCIRGKVSSSIAPAARTVLHRWLGSYEKATMLLCPSATHARRLADLGLKGTLKVMGNWVPSPEGDPLPQVARKDFVVAGRVSREKGVIALVEAWKGSRAAKHDRLIFAGDGPLLQWLEKVSAEDQSIVHLGFRPAAEVMSLMAGSKATIMPSLLEESFGLSAAESLACGTPLITTASGALAEVNEGGVGEQLVEISSKQLDDAWSRIEVDWQTYSRNARKKYERCYSGEVARQNFANLLLELPLADSIKLRE